MELNQTLATENFESLLKEKEAFMLYFYQDRCGVCKTLFPKVKSLIESKFPEMELKVLDAEKNRELAAQLRMLAVPGILLFFDGRESFRSSGLISLMELEAKIKRPYEMMFE